MAIAMSTHLQCSPTNLDTINFISGKLLQFTEWYIEMFILHNVALDVLAFILIYFIVITHLLWFIHRLHQIMGCMACVVQSLVLILGVILNTLSFFSFSRWSRWGDDPLSSQCVASLPKAGQVSVHPVVRAVVSNCLHWSAVSSYYNVNSSKKAQLSLVDHASVSSVMRTWKSVGTRCLEALNLQSYYHEWRRKTEW